MAHTNVSSCVLSIIASFSSSLDVFKQLKETHKGKKRPKAAAKLGHQEIRLARSLRQGPEDIGREYQKSIQVAGDHFAVGDAIAQSSLAEVLLKLNTGLVSIISSFLNRDKKDVQLDYQSLTSLSERSRIDTCRTLRHLFRRMSQAHAPRPMLALQGSEQSAQPTAERKKKRRPSTKRTKMQGPMLARVVIQDSSKRSQIALVKTKERRKKSTSSNAPSKMQSEAPSDVSMPLSSPPPYDVSESKHAPTRPEVHRSQTAPDMVKPRCKQSTANVRSPPVSAKPEALQATKSTPRLHNGVEHRFEPSPPVPTRPLLEDGEPRRRKLTPTYYSIASDSTKLGEIPLHKWPVPFDFDQMSIINKEAERNGWPLNQLDDGEAKKKRFGIMRLFRKKETSRV